jgi:electron transfer flavoprotein beta subunit
MVISSYDDYAIEAALQLKEAHGGEVVVVSAGAPSVKDAVSRALAMGADRGIVIEMASNDVDTRKVAQVLAERLAEEQCDIILAGQNSDDAATGQVGPQVAEYLGLPSVSSVVDIVVDGSTMTMLRDMEDGKQRVSVETPVVILASSGLNEPRYPSLKGIMAAKKKPLDVVIADVAPSPDISWGEPFREERAATGIIISDLPAAEAAAKLAAWLKEQKLV